MEKNVNKFSIILYSSIFIVITYLLLLKTNAQIYFLLNLLPLLIIGLCTPVLLTISSFFLSNLILITFFNTNIINEVFELSYYSNLNLILTFILVLSYTSLLKIKIKKSWFQYSKVLSYYLLIISIFLFIFLKFFFFEIDFENSLNEIKKVYLETFRKNGLDISKELEKILVILLNIYPALNVIFLVCVTIVNTILAQKFLEKLEINYRPSINFKNFNLPNWYFFLLIIFFVNFILFKDNFEIIFLNLFLVFSSLFIIKGTIKFLDFLKKINLPNSLKFLLLFLLFLFFSYLLLIFLFLIGINEQIKGFYKNKLIP
tara:strand:+ start:30 stop:977 length:948 start_codon:yes stop_codon:yes gene_type:complete